MLGSSLIVVVEFFLMVVGLFVTFSEVVVDTNEVSVVLNFVVGNVLGNSVKSIKRNVNLPSCALNTYNLPGPRVADRFFLEPSLDNSTPMLIKMPRMDTVVTANEAESISNFASKTMMYLGL